MKKQFHIGEISEFFNLPASTLRHWESTGILTPKKNHENNYREYTIEYFMISPILFFTKVWDSRSNRYKRWNSPPLKSIPFYYMKKLMN